MRQLLILPCAIFLVVSTVTAQDSIKKDKPTTTADQTKDNAGNQSKQSSGDVEQALMQMERDWAAALVQKDVAAYDRIVAADFVGTAPDGMVTTKAQALADLKSEVFKFDSSTVDDLKVRVFGDTAVVTYRTTAKGQIKARDISGQYRWTDVFVKRDGRWQVVAGHGSRIVE